ncbi:MAG: hypothetical protein MK000_08450, partial [Anaerolineales bacterium]|nr:hypothetical protein [Anaerolineales bacterium]
VDARRPAHTTCAAGPGGQPGARTISGGETVDPPWSGNNTGSKWCQDCACTADAWGQAKLACSGPRRCRGTPTPSPTSTVTSTPTRTATTTPTSTATNTLTSSVTSTATSPATSTTPGTPTKTPPSTPSNTPEPDEVEEDEDTADTEPDGGQIGPQNTPGPDVEESDPQNTPGPIEVNVTPPTIAATVLAISTPTSELPPPLVIVSTATPFDAIPQPTDAPTVPTDVSVGLVLTRLLSDLGDTQVIREAIRASPVGNAVARMIGRLVPELAPMPTASPTATPTAAPAALPVNEAAKQAETIQVQSPAPPPSDASLWVLILILLLPLLLAILFVILLCMRNVTKTVVRFLLAQLVLLGSMLVILFIIFSSSPWLLEVAGPQTFAVMLVVLLLEEACLFLCVVMQRCEKHYVMHRISVDDFDLWKNVFDDLRSKLKGAGSKADFVFCDIDGANDIAVLSEVTNQKKGRAFVRADEPHITMEHSGAEGSLNANLLVDSYRSSGCFAKDCGAAYVLGEILVDDFDNWKDAFDKLRPELRAAGSKGELVFRNADELNRITVMAELANLEEARAFISVDALPRAMQHSGDQGAVHVYVLADVDKLP